MGGLGGGGWSEEDDKPYALSVYLFHHAELCAFTPAMCVCHVLYLTASEDRKTLKRLIIAGKVR